MNEYKEKSRATFNAQATTYDTTMQGAHARRLYPQVVAALADVPEAGELLDVGCGTGALARLVLEQRPLSLSLIHIYPVLFVVRGIAAAKCVKRRVSRAEASSSTC